ncbi:MAG: hypothetical protein HQ521_06270 [Bacteroidetes bacterium]|nr:hypothetical protein [Bacteroidota bacterium]
MKNMKKLFIGLVAAFSLFAFQPLMANSAIEATPSSLVDPSPTNTSKELIERLDEIKDIDKTELSPSEKKVLRKEVRYIKDKLDHSGPIYISGATILLIVILIILL